MTTDTVPVSLAARYAHPVRFFTLATAIPWALWLPAAYASHQGERWQALVAVLGVLGLCAPAAVAWWMTRHDEELRRDIVRRLVDLRGVHPGWVLAAVGLMPAAILVATAISVLLGYSPDQFGLRGSVTFTAGVLPGWTVLVLAPIVEELAWHSYGTDALHTRFSVFTTSMVFVPIWAIWHLPLAFIAGSSQAQTAEAGWLYALNFPVSMIPFVLLMNWIYFRTGRNITLTVLFHLAANLVTQVLATEPVSELIATGVLLVATALMLWWERSWFFAPGTLRASSAGVGRGR